MAALFCRFNFEDNNEVYIHRTQMTELAKVSIFFSSRLNEVQVHIPKMCSRNFQFAINISRDSSIFQNQDIDYKVLLALHALDLMTPKLLDYQWQKVQRHINYTL